MWTKVLFGTMITSIAGIVILQAVSVYAGSVKSVEVATEVQETVVVAIDLPESFPFPQVDILAQGAYLGKVDLVSGTVTPLYTKNEHQVLPIASISKLITAYVSLQNRSLKDRFTITEWAVSGPWPSQKFQVGDTYTLRELLEASLVESNNDAARVLATSLGEQKFVQNMNLAASALALTETSLFSADGTDKVVANQMVQNTSTSHDIAQLIVNLYRYAPDILGVTTKSQVEISDVTGEYVFTAHTTNKLLNFFSNGYTLLGGKTGTSDVERKHLVLLFTDPQGETYVAVVLDTKDNFKDMQTILDTLIKYNNPLS